MRLGSRIIAIPANIRTTFRDSFSITTLKVEPSDGVVGSTFIFARLSVWVFSPGCFGVKSNLWFVTSSRLRIEANMNLRGLRPV